MRFSADLVAVKLDKGDPVAVRMTGDSGRDISADVQLDGDVESSIRARPRPNETNVPEVARIFREHLNKSVTTWQDPQISANASAKEERGVDFVLRTNDSSIDCQVVRPALKSISFWVKIARGETVQTNQDFSEAAEELKNAIAQKEKIPPRDRPSITLVIDSIETPGLVLQGILSEFSRSCGGWASSLGFAAIWVVGPTAELTIKLT